MMRSLCTVVLAVISTTPLRAAETLARVAPEDFAILAWSDVSNDSEALRGVWECGFNLTGPAAPEHLDAVSAAGLKAIVAYEPIHVDDGKVDRDEVAIANDFAPLIERTAQHPAAFGYFLRDEPNARMFPALGRHVAVLRRDAPNVMPCINLFPNYASLEQLGTATYEEHLEQYVSIVKPPVVSYDHYALMEDGSLRSGYFANLEAVRKVALAHDLPFWNVVLSNAHFNHAEPTAAGLRFQAYTTLAYGGRGICYFTYVTPDRGNYRLGPIDQFGHKTATWDMLRNVNLQTQVLAPTMITLKSVGVFHHGVVPDGCRTLSDSKYVAALSGAGTFIVGEFEGAGGRPHVMVVNKDLHASTYFDLRFRQPGTILQTNSYTGQTRPWVGEDCWLAAGQGMLLSLQR